MVGLDVLHDDVGKSALSGLGGFRYRSIGRCPMVARDALSGLLGEQGVLERCFRYELYDSGVFVLLDCLHKKRIIVSVTNDLCTDNRVRKVCEFLVAHDFELTLVGRKLKGSLALENLPYKTKRFHMLFKKGAAFYACYNLRLFFFLLFHKADVLLANDLDTLLANHWAKKFKSNCKLIYDSHEYFIGVPELINKPRVQNFWRRIEKKCLPKVDRMYTVNESIAALYRKEYNIPIEVVRNISDAPKNIQPKSRSELGLPEDKKIIIFQGAGINIDRGAEELIDAMNFVESAILIFVGSGDVIEQLKIRVQQSKLDNRVIFFGKKPYAELLNYTTVSDLGVSLDKDTNINYKFSLPNKIFDYLHCSIPMLVSDLPEIRKIVDHYQIGLVTPNHNPKEIAQLINALFADPERYQKMKARTKVAAAELTWQNECRVLEKIYL
jgi:glycosyltransferase involved in cell wall biosynthesis